MGVHRQQGGVLAPEPHQQKRDCLLARRSSANNRVGANDDKNNDEDNNSSTHKKTASINTMYRQRTTSISSMSCLRLVAVLRSCELAREGQNAPVTEVRPRRRKNVFQLPHVPGLCRCRWRVEEDEMHVRAPHKENETKPSQTMVTPWPTQTAQRGNSRNTKLL